MTAHTSLGSSDKRSLVIHLSRSPRRSRELSKARRIGGQQSGLIQVAWLDRLERLIRVPLVYLLEASIHCTCCCREMSYVYHVSAEEVECCTQQSHFGRPALHFRPAEYRDQQCSDEGGRRVLPAGGRDGWCYVTVFGRTPAN